jgi:hypothetical protein
MITFNNQENVLDVATPGSKQSVETELPANIRRFD